MSQYMGIICKINPYLEIVGLKYNYYTGTKNSVVYMQVARLVCEKSTCVVSDLDGPHQMNKITKEQRQQYVYHGVSPNLWLPLTLILWPPSNLYKMLLSGKLLKLKYIVNRSWRQIILSWTCLQTETLKEWLASSPCLRHFRWLP